MSRKTILGAIVAALALGAPSAASAGTYKVSHCKFPDGTATPAEGWTASNQGAYTYFGNTCGGTGGTVFASFDPGVARGGGEYSAMHWTAPADTAITYLTVSRNAAAGESRPYGTPVAGLYASTGVIEECHRVGSCASVNGTLSTGLNDATWLEIAAHCNGFNGCVPGDTHYWFDRLETTLFDGLSPTFTATPSGTLTDASVLTATRSLAFAATDRGGGLYRSRLIVDGTSQGPQVISDNSGRCAAPFHNAVPCALSSSSSLTYDTRALADGKHELQLDIRDATDENKAVSSSWQITVDNLPPTVTRPVVSGRARSGDLLSAASTINGQNPTTTYQWLRARADGSGPEAIVGATGATYLLTDADVGKKVLVRVTATDHGGTGSAQTTATDAPFGDGKLVEAYCVDRATGVRDECGDFDNDHTVNREDSDDDGDGVIDTDDESPFDPALPVQDPCKGKPTGPKDPCGDFDADGLRNELDGDRDDDGTPASKDTDDFDATIPGQFTPSRPGEDGSNGTNGANGANGSSGANGSTAPAAVAASATPGPNGAEVNRNDPAAVAVANPISAAGANGDPVDEQAVIAVRFERGTGANVRTTGRIQAGFGERIRIRGTITTKDGRAIRGAQVFLAQRPVGGSEWKIDGGTVSRADGSLLLFTSLGGQSRELRLVYFPYGGRNYNRAGNPLTLLIRQDARLSLSSRSLRNGQTLKFAGVVKGAISRDGAAVQLQVKLRTGWYTFKRVTATRRSGGSVRASYRFTRTFAPTRYRFRLKVVPRNSTRYVVGYSRVLSVMVRP